MMAHRLMHAARKAAGLGGAVAIAWLICGAAYAGDCNEDIGNLTKKRQAIIDQLNHLAKGGKNSARPDRRMPEITRARRRRARSCRLFDQK